MFSHLKSMFSGLAMLIAGLVMLYLAIGGTNMNHRLTTNPHARARVERTSTPSGKNASRYADLSFPRPEGGALCHAPRVRLGPASVPAATGQRIDVAPIPGSRDAPDTPTAAEPAWLLTIQYVFSLFAFVAGVMRLVGRPPPFERRYA